MENYNYYPQLFWSFTYFDELLIVPVGSIVTKSSDRTYLILLPL